MLFSNNSTNTSDSVYSGQAIVMEGSLGLSDECRLSAKWPPTLRPSQPTWAVSSLQAAIIYTHRRHLLLLLSQNVDCTIPQRVEGWVAGYIYLDGLLTRRRSPIPVLNQALHRLTALIETNML